MTYKRISREGPDYAPRVCTECPAVYSPHRKNQRTCSPACSKRRENLRQHAAAMVRRHVVTCLFCKETRKVHRHDAVFCSRSCKDQAQRKGFAAQRKPKAPSPGLPCASCEFAKVSPRGELGYLCEAGGGMLRCRPLAQASSYQRYLEEAT